MKNLLKADFYRLSKNKLVYISLIVSLVLPFLISGMIFGVKEFLKSIGDDSSSALYDLVLNSHAIVSTTFSFANNFGIVLPVFATTIIIADITSGTIRNKLILGYNRHKIFFSHFIVTLTYCLTLIIVYTSMTALSSSLFLGTGTISQEHATSLVYFYILGVISYVMVSAFATFLSLSTFSGVGSVILTVAFCMGIGLISTLFAMVDYSSFQYVVYAIPSFVTTAFQTSEITLTMFLESLVGTLVFTALFYVAGTFIFNKKDLK